MALTAKEFKAIVDKLDAAIDTLTNIRDDLETNYVDTEN